MDSLLSAAARALSDGDPLGALTRVSLRDDPPALALRGIAMAQLGEHARASELLRHAARAFGEAEQVARARCTVAAAEVALATRDLAKSQRGLQAAAALLAARGDRANALHARLLMARTHVLTGRLAEAARELERLDGSEMPAASAAVLALTRAEIELRSLRIDRATAALARAGSAAAASGIPALISEVADARASLDRPVARRRVAGRDVALRLGEVARLVGSGALVVDGCRRGLQQGETWRPLARRPVVFELARALAEASPGDVGRIELIARLFRTRRPDESHRARLRVAITRLRALVHDVAEVEATARGYVLRPRADVDLVLLTPPLDGEGAAVLALLADGAAWSASALSLALGRSPRTVQRALASLEAARRVRPIGRGRARRWLCAPLTGFATTLLLPATLPPA